MISNQNLPNVQAVGRLRYRAQEVNRVMLRSTMAKTPDEVARYTKDFNESVERYAELTKKYLETPFLPGEEAVFQKSEAAWGPYMTLAAEIVKLAVHPENGAKIEKLLEEDVPKLRRPHDDALSDLLAFHDTKVSEAKLQAAEATQRAETFIGIIISVGFLLAVSIGYMFASSLAKSLSRISGDISSLLIKHQRREMSCRRPANNCHRDHPKPPLH